MNTYDQHMILKIHEALHNPKVEKILVPREARSLEIKVASNGCRKASWKGFTFMEQNKGKNSKYGILAREGAQITWGISDKHGWLLVHDGEIKNPTLWPHP